MNQSLTALASDATPGALIVDRRAPKDEGGAAISAGLRDSDAMDGVELARYHALLGPLKELLDDRTVLNVDVNEDGRIWIERWNEKKQPHPERFERSRRKALLVYLANKKGQALDALHSRLQCDLPMYGYRVQGAGHPVEDYTSCIRVPVLHVPDLDEYVKRNIVSQAYADIFDLAIRKRLSIIVAGAVNTGKTTLMNSLLKRKARYDSDKRAVVVQDRREVRVAGEFGDYKIIMARVDQAHHESNGVVVRYTYEFSDALEDAMRSNGAFLVWGEVRDGYSAFGLVMAQNTGSSGLITTIQASSALGIPDRIAALIELNGKTPVPALMASVADLLIYMDFDENDLRRVVQVAVMEPSATGYSTKVIRTVAGLEAFLARRAARKSALAASGEEEDETVVA